MLKKNSTYIPQNGLLVDHLIKVLGESCKPLSEAPRSDMGIPVYQPDDRYLVDILKLARVILEETKGHESRYGHGPEIRVSTREKLKHAVDMYDLGKG